MPTVSYVNKLANRCYELGNEVGPVIYFCCFQQNSMPGSTFKATFSLKYKLGWHPGCRLPWKRQRKKYNQKRAKSEGSRWTSSSWRDPLSGIPEGTWCQQDPTEGRQVLEFRWKAPCGVREEGPGSTSTLAPQHWNKHCWSANCRVFPVAKLI